MYHCSLSIQIFSKDPSWETVLRKIAPLERFEHTVQTHDNFSLEFLRDGDIVILDLSLEKSLENIRSVCKKDALFILCATQNYIMNMTEPSYAAIDDLWTKPCSPAFIAFRFQKILAGLKLNEDYRLNQIWLDTAIDSIPDLVWFKDLRGAHWKVNSGFCSAVGKTKADIEGRGHYYIWDIDEEEYAQGEYICLESETLVIEARKTCIFDEKVKSQHGMRQFKTYKSPLFADDGTVIGTVGIAHDVTDWEIILHNANTDFLTGLRNRRFFYEYVKKHRGTQQFSLLSLDLDYLKKINDTFGHQTGDEALMTFARLLSESFPHDLVARIGGDEFLIALFGTRTLSALEAKATALLHKIQFVVQTSKNLKNLSASIGIASTVDPNLGIDELVRQSDIALYEAKHRGRAQYCVYRPELQFARQSDDRVP